MEDKKEVEEVKPVVEVVVERDRESDAKESLPEDKKEEVTYIKPVVVEEEEVSPPPPPLLSLSPPSPNKMSGGNEDTVGSASLDEVADLRKRLARAEARLVLRLMI